MSGTYSFLPWLRRGLSNEISQPATGRSRAQVVAAAELTDGARTAPLVQQTFQLTGPGDVTGIDPDAIVRTEPRNWITDFEPNYLPFVEFYEEDFPWRLTPQRAGGSGNRQLIPWLTLLVLKPEEFERNRTPGRPLTSVVLKVADPADMFPPDDQLWAWAHTQLVAELAGGDTPDRAALNAALEANPDAGLSRVVSPRKLDPEEAYHAFLIPTFEVGRKAGLGIAFDDETASGLELSWASAGEFPVYHEWFFRTGERGDFEELARRLVPREIDPRVGIRDMDLADPNFGMPALPDNSAHRTVGLEGALKSPQTQSQPHMPGSSFPGDATAIVNAPAEAEANGAADPLVAPPIYGRWHALVNRVDPSPTRRGWVNVLNRDARHRAAAGLGSEVIRRNQETFMKRAWEQVGEVLEANRRIAMAQAAIQANRKLLAKTVEAKLVPAQTIALAGPLAKRVRAASRTVRADLVRSRATRAAYSGQVRKLTRPRGPVEIALSGGDRVLTSEPVVPRMATLTVALNTGKLTTASQPADITVATLEQGLDFLDSQRGGGTRPTQPGGIFIPTVPRQPFPNLPNLPRLPQPFPSFPTLPGLPGQPRDPVVPGGGLPGTFGGRGTLPPALSRRGATRFGLPGTGRDLLFDGGLTASEPTLMLTRDDTLTGLSVSGSAITALLGSGAILPDRGAGGGITGTLVIDTDLVATATVADRFGGIGLSKDAILKADLPDELRITAPPGSLAVSEDAPVLGRLRSAQFQKSLGDFANLLNFEVPAAKARPELDVGATAQTLVTALQPEAAFRKRLTARVVMGGLGLDHFANGFVTTPHERIVPAMACPDFKDPMYRHLVRMGDEFLVPNLGLVPPNTISLMLTNPAFIESYMVGLNVEFSSELLFREYPTDQRCSAFRQFWDVASIPRPPGTSEADHAEALKDIRPIHRWTRASQLGTNSPRTAGHSGGVEPRVVLVVRGDLLKKYPNTIIYAQSAVWGSGDRRNELILHDEDGTRAAADITDPDIHFPTFKAQVQPDLHFIGFDLTLDEVRGHPDLEETARARARIPANRLGKYFVIQEVAGEARFGMDVSGPSQPSDEKWDNLAWTNIDLSPGPVVDLSRPFISPVPGTDTTGFQWGSNAADMAAILYQKPAMLAYHGRDMLKDL